MAATTSQQELCPVDKKSKSFTDMSFQDSPASLSTSSGRPILITLLIVIAAGLSLICILLICGAIPSVITDLGPALGEVRSSVNELSEEMHEHILENNEVSSITKTWYGRLSDGTNIDSYSLKNKHGMEARVITLGGILTHLFVPDARENLVDVVLGFDTLKEYEEDNSYLGALIGRFAGRIKHGRFSLDGSNYQLNNNNLNNSLHGGKVGWNKAVWNAVVKKDILVLSHISPDRDENYPGEVHVQAAFHINQQNELELNISAVVKRKATPINLTTHPYFNLAGQGTIEDHRVQIFADNYLPGSSDVMPTGTIAPVNGTVFDLIKQKRLGDILNSVSIDGDRNGFDHNFCIRGPTGQKLMARIEHPSSGRVMEIFSNQPGLQFYTGNYLSTATSKGGHGYSQWEGFCMEPQGYPDAINIHTFPDCVLRPGSTYMNNMAFKFSAV